MRRARRGFTLIEMMVVVAIIAILAGLLISTSSRPVGANARNGAQQVTSVLSFARLRAGATRRVHMVQVLPDRLVVYACANTGLVCSATPTDLIQQTKLGNGVKLYDATTALYPTGGASISENTSLNDSIYVRPDGQSTARTLFISDTRDTWRVLLYPVTGGAYARQGW